MKKLIILPMIFILGLILLPDVVLAESIHDIARHGSVSEMREALDGDIDINEYDYDGGTSLMYAAQYNDIDMVKFLLENGADVHLNDQLSDTPLAIYAAENEDLDLIKYLVDEGMYLHATDFHNINPLMIAVSRNSNPEVIKYLIDEGVSLTTVDNWGISVFRRVIENENPEIIKLILEAGKNIEDEKIRRSLYQASLDEAINRNNRDAIDLLVKEEEILNNRESLINAFESGHIDISRKLVKNGANVRGRDEDGRTPLMYAIVFDFELDLVEKIIENGANVNTRTLLGTTPLMEAAFYTNINYVKLLLDNGASLEVKDNLDNNVLLYASANENIEVLDYILQQDEIEINWENSNGENALIFAIRMNQNIDAVKMLIDNGVNIDITIDEENKTPLMVSVEETRKDVAEILLEKGADGSLKDSAGRTAFNYAEDVISFQGSDIYWDLNDAQY